MTMSDNAVTLTDENFSEETREGLALVDFWAPWCGPCRLVSPVIEELACDLQGKVKVRKLNVDENMKTSEKFRVMSIPTVILVKYGEAVEMKGGAQPKS